MFACRLTSSVVTHTSLNTQSDVEVQTIDDFYKIIKDTGEVVLKKKFQTPETLIDHLQSVFLITHINMTSENKNLKKDYTSIFKIARAVITTDVANDPRPFDMTRFDTHKKNIVHFQLVQNTPCGPKMVIQIY